MFRMVLVALFAALLLALVLTPSPACPPAQYSTYSQAACATNYVAPAAPVYYAYPLTLLAVPVATVQPQVPAAAPVPQAEVQAPPAPAAMTVTIPQANVIVQRQVYANYAAPALAVNSYAYGMAQRAVVVQKNVVVRQRAVHAPQVVVQRQRRVGPIRGLIQRLQQNRQARQSRGGTTVIVH